MQKLPLPSINLKKEVTSYPYHANTTGMYSSCPKKNSTALKLQPPRLTNLKKEKGFFLFFFFF
jgi:hypothetical protein